MALRSFGITFPYAGLALFALVGGVVGCEGDPADAAVGVWTVNKKKSQIPPVPLPGAEDKIWALFGNAVLQLKPDRSYSFSLGKGSSGKWALKGNTLTLTPADGAKLEVELNSARTSGTVHRETPLGDVVLAIDKTG
jgi:hypothetical protein